MLNLQHMRSTGTGTWFQATGLCCCGDALVSMVYVNRAKRGPPVPLLSSLPSDLGAGNSATSAFNSWYAGLP